MDERDKFLHPGLLGQDGTSLDMPRAVGDADDVAANRASNGPRGPANAAAEIQHAHALLEPGYLSERLFVCRHAFSYGEAWREWRVVELLTPVHVRQLSACMEYWSR